MVNFLYNLLLMSISGTLMYLLSLPLSGRKRYVWLRYAALIAAVLLMLVPVGTLLHLPKIVNVPISGSVFASGGYTAISGTSAAPPLTASIIGLIFLVWLTGAAVSLIRFTVKYSRSAKILRQITSECRDVKALSVFSHVAERLNIRANISLRTSENLNSPMLFGALSPMVIIPAKEFSERELEMILAHELTHYRHRDLPVAFLAAAAKCLHWFNPAAYMADRAIITARELCCDEAVLERLSPDSKREYGNLLLSVIEMSAASQLAYTTSMASSKVSIQRRLIKIIEHRTRSRLFKLGCVVLVASLAVSSVTAFGFELAAEIIPEEIKEELEQPISLADTAEAFAQAFMPEEEAAPEAEPAATEAQEAAETTPEEPAAEQEYQAAYDEAYEEAEPEVYIFGESSPAPEPVIAAEQEYKTIALSDSSYMFKPDFSTSDTVRSDNFDITPGASVSIQKYTSPGSDLRLEIYDAATDEIFIAETDTNARKRISFFTKGGVYYIIAYCTTGGCDGIYVSKL